MPGVLDEIENNAAPINTGSQQTVASNTANSALPSYEASTYDPSGYTSDSYDASGYDASGYGSVGYDATTEEIGEDQLVLNNVDKVLDKGGVLMDVARSAGDEYSASRGMLDSSMGAQASMRSMIDTALPIASQDAASQLSQLQANQGYENRASEFGASAENVASQFNTAAENQAAEFTAGSENRASEFNIGSANRASEFTAGAENTAGQINTAAENQAAQFNATAEIQQTRDSVLQSYQLQMENLSTNNRSLLIDLEQKYARAIQSDKNASDVYRSTMEQIGELMSNGDLSVPQQESGMTELFGMLGSYLEFNDSLSATNSNNVTTQDGSNVDWSNSGSGDYNSALDNNDPKIASMVEAYSRNPVQFEGYGVSSDGGLINIQGAYTSSDGLTHQNNMVFAQSPSGMWAEVKAK